jgi:hypothetical protein
MQHGLRLHRCGRRCVKRMGWDEIKLQRPTPLSENVGLCSYSNSKNAFELSQLASMPVLSDCRWSADSRCPAGCRPCLCRSACLAGQCRSSELDPAGQSRSSELDPAGQCRSSGLEPAGQCRSSAGRDPDCCEYRCRNLVLVVYSPLNCSCGCRAAHRTRT